MGLGSLVRDVALPLVNTVIGGQDGLKDDVTIQYWEYDEDEAGTGHYSSPVSFQAVVVRQSKMVKKSDGQEAMSATYLAFTEAMPAHGGADRREPLDERDIITLSDGTTGPILSIEGLMDQVASAPYLLEVYLG